MASLGVQILTMDSVTSRIFKDETLCAIVSETLASFIKELVDSKAMDQQIYYNTMYLRFDLKYIAKPALMPQLVQETSIVENLMNAVC